MALSWDVGDVLFRRRCRSIRVQGFRIQAGSQLTQQQHSDDNAARNWEIGHGRRARHPRKGARSSPPSLTPIFIAVVAKEREESHISHRRRRRRRRRSNSR